MIFAFLVSFFSFAHIKMDGMGGELYISELLFAAYLFCSINKFRLLSEPLPHKILLLGGLWLLSQIATDLIRDTPPENYLRGWAAIIFFLVDFCAVYIMARKKPDVVRVLVLGGALGAMLALLALPTNYSEAEPWKFGYGPPVTMLALLYLSTGNRYKAKYGLVLLAMLGVLGVYLNARSLGGMTMLTAAILYLGQKPGFINYENQRRNPLKLVGIAAGVLISIFGILFVYQWTAESGYLPENVTEKYFMGKTKNAGLLGLLVGGRPEILISSQAVIDSPIIGHGSWAEDAKYAYMRYAVADKLGLNINEAYLKYSVESSNLIPTHSVLMQAWVWAGLLGAVFWLFVLRFITRKTFASFTISHALQPLVLFSGISGIWNLLFSPFGGGERISWAIVLVLIFIGSMMLESNLVEFHTKARGMIK